MLGVACERHFRVLVLLSNVLQMRRGWSTRAFASVGIAPVAPTHARARTYTHPLSFRVTAPYSWCVELDGKNQLVQGMFQGRPQFFPQVDALVR